MNKYRKGRALEYRVIHQIKAEGWECTRSAGSKGVFDIVAWDDETIRFIQVKANKPPSAREVERIMFATTPPNASVEVWIFRDRDPNPEVIEYGPVFVYGKGEVA